MKPSIILYKALPDDLLHRLEEHFTVTQVPDLSPQTVEQHAQAFASAEGLLGSSQTVDTALLEKMPTLRATSTISVGYDNFDVDALNARKVLLMHTPTVLTETVARYDHGTGAIDRSPRCGSGRAREGRRMDLQHWS